MKKLASTLVVLVYLLLLIGATVRTMGAGMACPDWPTCNGEWIPAFDPLVFAEWFHRLFVILVTVVTFVLSLRIWSSAALRRSLGGLALVAVLLLFAQAGLGAITVFQNNSPHTVTAHLLLGAIFFSVVIWLRRSTKNNSAAGPVNARKIRSYRLHIYASLTLIFIQLGLGAMVSSSHAGLVCPDFPTCNGLWLPPMVGPVALQMMHRYMAYAVILIIVGTFFVGRKVVTTTSDRRMLKLMLATVILQLLLGVGLIHAKIPHAMSVAHLGLAMLLWGMLTGLAYGIQRR